DRGIVKVERQENVLEFLVEAKVGSSDDTWLAFLSGCRGVLISDRLVPLLFDLTQSFITGFEAAPVIILVFFGIDPFQLFRGGNVIGVDAKDALQSRISFIPLSRTAKLFRFGKKLPHLVDPPDKTG